MADTLDRIIYGSTTGKERLTPLALSGALDTEDAEQWRSMIAIAPLPQHTTQSGQSVGIFAGPNRNYLLATAFQQAEDAEKTLYQIVLLPRKLVQQAAGNLDPLVALISDTMIDIDTITGTTITPLDAPSLLPWQPEDRLQHFRTLLENYAQGDIDRVLKLLGAVLTKQRLLICGFENDTKNRVELVQGLMALLPAPARADLTFSTYIVERTSPDVMLAFADHIPDTTRWIANGTESQFPDTETLEQPYIQLLHDLWQGDASEFIDALVAMEPLAEVFMAERNLEDGLNRLSAQVRLNQQVIKGETVAPEDLKATLAQEIPLDKDLTRQYTTLLLHHALDDRDTEAALLVAMAMDEDEALDEALYKILNDALQTQPDAVYVFVRTRVNDAMEIEEKWQNRLHTAAMVSLQVAINDADSETISNWLRLIAREPANYQLDDILREGILAAQTRAHEDGELARHLVILAIKNTPDIIDTLLDDEALLAALPNNIGLVLRDHTGDPLQALSNRGPEIFLVAMARATEAQITETFTNEIIDQVWQLYTGAATYDLPDHYLPEYIIERWITVGAAWLPPETLNYLASLMLADMRDELFLQFAEHLTEHDLLRPLLSTAIQGSQRDIEDIIKLLTQITNAGYLSAQAAAEIYVELLAQREWRQTSLPLVEQLTRLIQHNPELELHEDTIWRMLNIAAGSRSESVARTAAYKVFSSVEADDTEDDELVDTLTRLTESLQWSSSARQHLLRWWREYVRSQSVARLAQMDKLLEGKRPLVQCHSIVQTTLAFRRMLGQRNMSEFAEAINTVFTILEDLSESFDPSPRQPTNFDEDTIRAELDARREDISDHEWHILAKNFRELAGLIGAMGDHRSKGSLVRQNVDRQLLAGAQQPESAVDTLKWMAGYLEGVQDRNNENNE